MQENKTTENATQYDTDTNESVIPKDKPKSGFSIKKIRTAVITIISIVLIAVGIANAMDPYSNIMHIDEMRQSYSYAKEVIKDEVLLSPSSAKFPDFEPDFVTQKSEEIEYGGKKYYVRTVTAYVDSENAFGVSCRLQFQVKIGLPLNSKVDSDYYYEIISVE